MWSVIADETKKLPFLIIRGCEHDLLTEQWPNIVSLRKSFADFTLNNTWETELLNFKQLSFYRRTCLVIVHYKLPVLAHDKFERGSRNLAKSPRKHKRTGIFCKSTCKLSTWPSTRQRPLELWLILRAWPHASKAFLETSTQAVQILLESDTTRPDHNTGNSVPYSYFDQCVGPFMSRRIMNNQELRHGVYGLSSLPEKTSTRKFNHLQM